MHWVATAPISIHVPRERDDASYCLYFRLGMIFQSTSLVRGTTSWGGILKDIAKISIHVPRERDDVFCGYNRKLAEISIHVPRERDDRMSFGERLPS